MTPTELALSYTGVALQVALLLALLRTGCYRQFAAFSSYTLFSLASTIVVLALRDSPGPFLWAYWISEAFNVVFVFLALLEIFKSVFSSFYRMNWFRLLFPGIGVLMLLLAIIRTLVRPMPSGGRLFSIIIALEIADGFLQMGIFLLFLVLIWFFRVHPKQYAFGLALGFGILASGFLLIYLLRSEFGTKFNPVVRIGPPIAYTLSLVVWLVTFLAPQPVTTQPGITPALTPEQMLADIKRYAAFTKRIFKS
jgi:hypothetical protein